ncbi:MAG: hypothetical protein R6W90_18520 [Ignavibacteriaceae bacterium]
MLNLLPVIKIISKSSAVASTVNALVKQFNSAKAANQNVRELQKALEVQASLNENLETQLVLLQSAIDNLQKSVKTLSYILYACVALSIAAIIIAILL